MTTRVNKQIYNKRLYNLLYTDATYFLQRKYLKLGSLLGKPNNVHSTKTGKSSASDNPVLASSLGLTPDNNYWASVETLRGTPEPVRDGEEKVHPE